MNSVSIDNHRGKSLAENACHYLLAGYRGRRTGMCPDLGCNLSGPTRQLFSCPIAGILPLLLDPSAVNYETDRRSLDLEPEEESWALIG
jgi:hypothetical protein